MLTRQRVESILARLPTLTIGVVGDLFLDRYLDLDERLTEPSIETGLDAYQVVAVRSYPGAAGTVINNLVALGVGRVLPLAVIGQDGEGFELRQALDRVAAIDCSALHITNKLRTPTYTKPMLGVPGGAARELNRIDIKNRTPLSSTTEGALLWGLPRVWERCDALVVLDQVSEENCGVVTERVRECIAELAETTPTKFVLADSRERIGLFRNVAIKPNEAECARTGLRLDELAKRVNRPVFCTRGAGGMLLVDPPREIHIPAYPVSGPIDIVGAGDSCSAAVVSAVGAGASLEEAAMLGNLVASITIQQIGRTGTATPEQVLSRLAAIDGARRE